MESLNVKNINDEKIFNVIDPNGQGEVVNRIRPISISINQKAQTINDQTDSTINLAVYWNDTWKSILDLTFDESLRQEYGKLVEDLTSIQKDIDMKQYKDAETKTADFLKYVANLSNKYTSIPETSVVAETENDFVKVTAEKNSVKATISDSLLNFMLKKFAKVDNLDYAKANECFSTSKFNFLANNYDIYYHSPEIFQKQAYMTVVKDNKVVGSYKVNYDQFSKFASKFMLTPQKLGYSKDRLAGYMKTAEVVMQNIFFDSVDEAKEWQEMVDEKKREQATTPEGEEETTETTTTETETKTEMGEGKSESPIKEDGGLARPSEDFASDEIPESEPRQQEQQGGGQNLGASRKVKNVKKTAKVGYNAEPENELEEKVVEIGDEIMGIDGKYSNQIVDLAFDSQDNPNKKEENDKKITDLKDKLKKEIKVVIDKNKADFTNKEFYDLFYEHLQDNNFHTANKIIEELLNGKQASKKVNLNKKALYGDVQEQDIVPAKTETKVYLQSEDKGNKKQLPNFSVTVRRHSDDEVVDIIECNNQKEAEETYKYMLSDLDKDCYVSINKLVGKEEYEEIKNSSLNKEESCKKANKNKLVQKKAEEELSRLQEDADKYIKEDVESTEEYLKKYLEKSPELFKAQYGVETVEEALKLLKEKNPNWYKKAAEEETVEENEVLAIGDIVAIDVDTFENEKEFIQYGDYAGIPLVLMETDKDNIDNVIVETVDYPYERISVARIKIVPIGAIADEHVIVEDVDGDEMITTFEELPVVAKQCKIKSIHKAANINKKKANLTKKAINSLEDVAGLIDTIWSDYDWYEYADALEVGEKSHYENILADVQKDEKGTIEGILKLIEEDDDGYTAPEIEQLKEYYNAKFGGK